MSVDAFARKAGGLQASLEYSTARPRQVDQLYGAYRSIDGLTTIEMSESDAGQFVLGLADAVEVCESSLSKKRAFSGKKHESTITFMGELLIDKATVALQLPQPDYEALSGDMRRAQAVFESTRSMRSGHPDQYDNRRYSHDTIGNLFGHFSTRALQIHVDAKRIEAQNTYASDSLLRSRIGGLVVDATSHMRIMATEYLRKPDDSLRGRFVETAAYAFKTMDWHDAPRVSDAFVRFAVEREDRPATENRPRRSFDVLIRNQDEYLPLQVKTSGRSGGAYHHRITKLRLKHGDLIMQDPIGFTELFEATFSDDDSDAKHARTELGEYFDEKTINEPTELLVTKN